LEDAELALKQTARHSVGFKGLADSLGPISRLDWYKGRGGAFESVNFHKNHSHALLIGPGGLEYRTDLRMWMTVLGPYTRFPDHDQRRSRVLLRCLLENSGSATRIGSRLPEDRSYSMARGKGVQSVAPTAP
jgi:hypothetical protein